MNLSKFMQARPNVLLFRHASPGFLTRYLRFLGILYFLVNRRERNLIEQNIRMVFKNNEETNAIIRKTFDGIFFHYSEKLIMAYRNIETLKKEIGKSLEYSGIEHLDEAFACGGVLLVTGHFGAVEFMPLALHLRHYPVSMVVSFHSEKLKQSLNNRALEGDVELIDGHGKDILKQIVSALKRGRIVVTECDEVDAWKTKGNMTIDAFGGKIRMDRTLDIICRRSRATVLGSFMLRTPKGYQLTICPLGDEQKSNGELIFTMTLKKLENFVMQFPDQWYQWKKFHKMRPEFA